MEALLGQMQFFQLQRSDILWDNYLATGHEYNADGNVSQAYCQAGIFCISRQASLQPLKRHL